MRTSLVSPRTPSRVASHLTAVTTALGGDPSVVEFAREFELALNASLDAFGCSLPAAALPLGALKRQLAAHGYGLVELSHEEGGRGLSSSHQAALQFVCGYYDLDLRDVAHAGHGWLVLRDYNGPDRQLLLNAMARGELFGIAMTEPSGGTAIWKTETLAIKHVDGWRIRGLKRPISRVLESSHFVVLCRNRRRLGLTAIVIDAHEHGLSRKCETPSGLAGWSWGELQLNNVTVPDYRVLGMPGTGQEVIARHFAYYRLMVGATCLGAAARALDIAREEIHSRRASGIIAEPRDFVLMDLSDCASTLFEACLSVFALIRSHRPADNALVLSSKARAVAAATEISRTTSKLLASRGIPENSVVSKILRDLRAYEFADGVGDELRRSSGKRLLGDS